MSIVTQPSDVADEFAIAWLVQPGDIPWAREYVLEAHAPNARPDIPSDWRLVAYAVVEHRAGPQFYFKRLWFTKPLDASVYGDRDWPIEAVRLPTVRPRELSEAMGDLRLVTPCAPNHRIAATGQRDD